MIEKFVDNKNLIENIFDPMPSYADVWCFNLENIILNADKEKWNEFFEKSYKNIISKLFKNNYIFNINVGMISKPNNNLKGRSLQYNKYDFFVGLISFINDDIDNYKLNNKEREKRINDLIDVIGEDYEKRNSFYIECFKEKNRRLKDILEKEFNSEYFESAMNEYSIYKSVISFSDYIKKFLNVIDDFQNGLIYLNDFFEKNIDFYSLAKVLETDKICLLFAKIICDGNYLKELNNNFRFLVFYKKILDKIFAENDLYNCSILYKNKKGIKIKYTTKDFLKDYYNLENKHVEIKNYKLDNDLEFNETYKDIIFMEKINKLHNSKIWKVLDNNEEIPKGNDKELNLRINVLRNSGYIGRPMYYNNYYAFIYSNNIVIIEKIDNIVDSSTFVINIDEFIELSNIDNIDISEYFKNKDIFVKRIFHSNINNWHRNLYNEINGTYIIKDALEFIDNI